MSQYGVVDIGSNTVVLLIYGLYNGQPEVIRHESEPVHLVSYIKDGHISAEGIAKAAEVVRRYQEILSGYEITAAGGFITEPWRGIDNSEELLNALRAGGLDITALSGREEAEYDYLGSRLDCSDVMTGNAFDIGGGSTELISFRDGNILEAVSIPVGCVRLSIMPVTDEIPDQHMRNAFERWPGLLACPHETLIGIGGTCQAARNLCSALYGTDHTVTVAQLRAILDGLKAKDYDMTAAMHRHVSKGRWDVFAPGLNMLLGICRAYNADQVRISMGCVREGFLMHHLINQ